MKRRLAAAATLGDFERWILSGYDAQLDRAAQGDPHAPGQMVISLQMAGVGGAEAETAHIAALVRNGDYGAARNALRDLLA